MRKMKDSGIEWIGQIPEDWEINKTKYLFNVVNGARQKVEMPRFGMVKLMWITPVDYKTRINNTLLQRVHYKEEFFRVTSIVPGRHIIF